MGLFTKTEQTRIAELEAAVEAERNARIAAAAEHASALSQSRQAAAKDAKELGEVISRLEQERKDLQRALSNRELRIAQLEGTVAANDTDASKWRRLALGFTWHSAGSVELDGKAYRLMEARTDNPMANFRLPIPDGQEFP